MYVYIFFLFDFFEYFQRFSCTYEGMGWNGYDGEAVWEMFEGKGEQTDREYLY